MLVVKNTYGISSELSPVVSNPNKIGTFGGSSLDRKVYVKREKGFIELLLQQPLDGVGAKEKKVRVRVMSKRTKSKIRKKIIAFLRIHEKLTFVTLTFLNVVEDRKAVKLLGTFLKNVNKGDKNFQYIWVAEKQSKNQAFKNNIHFHLITNKGHWNIKRWWSYWLELQKRHGITARDESYKPSSAFDVKHIKKSDERKLQFYLTKYVTKNASEFTCQVWNCSKGISELHTEYYSGIKQIRDFKRLEEAGQLGGEIKSFAMPFCNIHLIPLNKRTLKFFERMEDANRSLWKRRGIA